ncbi:MAG TPA: DNA-3-methyladenine glycosylase I [Planktothrix sp.]|jgi:3-methyladenine DNA glycosylase Tag
MAIPEQIDADGLSDYLDIMTKAIFQAGLSWSIVESKWPAFRECFAGFDPDVVSQFSAKDLERLMKDERILRSKKKIDATIANAKTLIQLEKEYGGFRNYLHKQGDYDELSKDMRKRFKFLGELSVYYFLFRIKEPVPPFEKWVATIPGDHPRMREMVELARNKKK